MHWLAVFLPRWPLDALALPASPAGRVVFDAHSSVCAADDAALAAGVRPGMALASAQALCPDLQAHARERLREAALLHSLALALSRFTPQLVVRGDDGGLLLDIGTTLRLFGGQRVLVAGLRACLREQGVQARLGAAPTAVAAWWFAREGARLPAADPTGPAADWRTRLDALPLRVLQAEPRLAELLQGIGARNLGALRALPRAGLQRRGGGEVLRQLDRAYGDVPDPQRWFQPPAEFTLGLELMQRADDAAMLAFAAQRLVQALAGWLSLQWLAATAFTLWLQHESSGRRACAPTCLRIELGQPSRDAAQLMLLLRECLQRLPLPAPVYGLKLELNAAQPLAGHEGQLWKDATQHADDLRALLDRLSARLGAERVCRWALRADHRPEHAAVAWPAIGTPPADAVVQVPPLPRPAWLLPEPLPLAERAGRPLQGGQPLVLRSTPERIEAGWFDGKLVCRDYHVAEGSDHQLRWIYRERGNEQARWFLHGLFG
jgi:protein ImuB